MASKKIDIDGAAIAAAIAKELPGFRVAKQSAIPMDSATASDPCDEHGPTIQQLRKKFLGASADAADSGGGDGPEQSYGAIDARRVSVQVEPKDGGPSKTADIEEGRVKIVQG